MNCIISRITILFLALLPMGALGQIDTIIYKIDIADLISKEPPTGTFLSIDISESPVNLTIIDQRDIQLSGARHLSELLEIYVPGFQYMVNKWNGINWGMRGISSDRNSKFVFLVNGHKMNLESRDGAITELDLGLLGDIDRVEVLRGPAGLVYGSGAIAGVVNIVTQKNVNGNYQSQSEIGTWGGYGMNGSQEINSKHLIGDDGQLLLSAGWRLSQGVGQSQSRIYGRGSFPYPYTQTPGPEPSVPSNGSYWSTPGNGRMSATYSKGAFDIYTRYTSQSTPAQAYYMIDLWPEINGKPDTSARDVFVDGEWRTPEGWYGQSDLADIHNRVYILRNWSTVASYSQPIGLKNSLKVELGTDWVTEQIKIDIPNYQRNESYFETTPDYLERFGERRVNANTIFEIKSLEKLKLATGYQFRMFLFGNDLGGKNERDDIPETFIIPDGLIYFNNALFYEGMYELSDKWQLHLGSRYDLHSRTIQHGGAFSHHYGVQWLPNKSHRLRLFYNSAANTGTADNYEINRFFVNNEGEIYNDYHYDLPNQEPSEFAPVRPPAPSEATLRSLRPEKISTYELSYNYVNQDHLYGGLTASYNKVTDLFTWVQEEFRSTNGGDYNFFNIEGELSVKHQLFDIGISHTYQQVVNTDILAYEEFIRPEFSGFDTTSNGQYTPQPTGESDTTRLYPVLSATTVDGKNFINLVSNITKVQATLKLGPKWRIHSNARLFWGLKGRELIYNFDPKNNDQEQLSEAGWEDAGVELYKFEFLDVSTKAIVKWNLALHYRPTTHVEMALFWNDILASTSANGRIHSLRWQHATNAMNDTDLYAMDLSSFRFRLTYRF